MNLNHPLQQSQDRLLKQIILDEQPTLIHENLIQYDEPLIKFVDHIILEAIQQSTSDIHIEPYEKTCRIRYRQHGVLHETASIPTQLATRLAARLKVMAKLDIAERRLPQDGRFQLRDIDIRINTCPTLYGEKIVLRLLNSTRNSLDICTLGFTDTQKELFIKHISQPQGMILVTGPTGSGKTVTLYSALHYLNSSEKNISTVEDPIEIRLAGINQVAIHPKIGLDFATVLRTLLRQDPDILMVGEIRDKETADIALKAAQTGHLVFSTLHTNGAMESLFRLQSMGIETYHLVHSISLIVAQRLIRVLCHSCKKQDTSAHALFPELGLITTYQAVGCQHCTNGYTGRIAIHAFLILSDAMKSLILNNSDSNALHQQAKKEGFLTLKEIGIEKMLRGETSIAELSRVLYL